MPFASEISRAFPPNESLASRSECKSELTITRRRRRRRRWRAIKGIGYCDLHRVDDSGRLRNTAAPHRPAYRAAIYASYAKRRLYSRRGDARCVSR